MTWNTRLSEIKEESSKGMEPKAYTALLTC